MTKYLAPVLFCFLLSNKSLAEECEATLSCIPEKSWHIGLALGLGVRSNPLIDGDNVPLIVRPDIAWYGESAYFDNGEVGYQWVQSSKQSIEVFAHLDEERAFFSFWHPANILLPIDSGLTAGETPDGSESPLSPENSISIDDVAKRSWSVNGGIRWHYRSTRHHWKMSFEHDISGVHKGYKGIISYTHQWAWQDWKLSLSPSLVWKNSSLLNYHYGVSARDQVTPSNYYEVSAGLAPKVSLQIHKRLNSEWIALMTASYQALPKTMQNSPLVDRPAIHSVFIGAAYQF